MREIYMHSGTTIVSGKRSTPTSEYWKRSLPKAYKTVIGEILVLVFVLRAYGAKRNFPRC